MKRTPGPWQFGATQNGYWMVTHGANLLVTGLDYEGDARLIAAAPEAVAELERVTGLLATWAEDHPQDCTAEVDAALHCARAVIAKAKP